MNLTCIENICTFGKRLAILYIEILYKLSTGPFVRCTFSNNEKIILNLECLHDTWYDLRQCVCDINTWMAQNMFKLNTIKTQIILFGSKKQLAEVNIQSFDVAGIRVNVSEEPVRNLGAMFDSNFTMISHVSSVMEKLALIWETLAKSENYLLRMLQRR